MRFVGYSPIGLGSPVSWKIRVIHRKASRINCYKWGSGDFLGYQTDMEAR